MKIRRFNESFTEKVKFEDFIKDIRAKNEQEFDDCCASKGVKWTVCEYLEEIDPLDAHKDELKNFYE